MSPWWLLVLGLGSAGAVATQVGAVRLRRERDALRAASVATRALTATVTAARRSPDGPY